MSTPAPSARSARQSDPALAARIGQALHALVPAFGLRGLASLDFIAAQGEAWLLEINPRPSASMLLHADAWPEGLVRAHVQAVQGRLPSSPAWHRPGIRGSRIVFASEPCRIDAAQLGRLAHATHCHDLPARPGALRPQRAVCSVSAEAPDAERVEALLDERCTEVLAGLAPGEYTVDNATHTMPERIP
jgi:predicted ATP-grasp superfamily ATP-dependent carboligase